MNVIDCRARPNTPEYMAQYQGHEVWNRLPTREEPPTASLSSFVSELERHGVSKAVFIGRQVLEDGELVRGVSNDYVADCVNQYPDRLLGFAGIDHTTGDTATSEIRRAVSDLGLSGVSIDHHYADPYLSPSDESLYPIYETITDLDVPVSFTMGPQLGPKHDPDPIHTVAENFPSMSIICSHGCWPKPTEFVALAYRRENVYLEASVYEFPDVWPGVEPFLDGADGLIQDSVIYSSAFPFDSLGAMERVKQLPLSTESLEKILYENAARLLDFE